MHINDKVYIIKRFTLLVEFSLVIDIYDSYFDKIKLFFKNENKVQIYKQM